MEEEVMSVKPATIRSRILALSTSHHTCIHMLLHQLVGFCGISMLQSPASVKPKPWWKIKLPIYPFDRSRKGVDQWTFLLGCVRVGHRNMGNQKYSQDSLRFARTVCFEL